MNNMKKVVAFITAGSPDEAETIARILVDEKLAACCNVVNPIISIYRWQGKVHRDQEVLLIAKSTAARFERLKTRVKELHSYDVPEVISLPITDGLPEYLHWIETETGEELGDRL